MTDLFGNTAATQSDLSFPASLTDTYRPRTIDSFIGLAKPKAIAAKIAARPFASAWTFKGDTGTGKTTLALALAAAIPAELHHVPSQSCNIATLERLAYTCNCMPMSGFNFHLILVDEADQMSAAAQLFLLSKLDGTAPLPNTIWIFTCNATDRLEKRFLDRTKVIEFSSYGIAGETAALLERIWQENAPAESPAPNFARIVKDSNNSVRESLMKLELELMLRA